MDAKFLEFMKLVSEYLSMYTAKNAAVESDKPTIANSISMHELLKVGEILKFVRECDQDDFTGLELDIIQAQMKVVASLAEYSRQNTRDRLLGK